MKKILERVILQVIKEFKDTTGIYPEPWQEFLRRWEVVQGEKEHRGINKRANAALELMRDIFGEPQMVGGFKDVWLISRYFVVKVAQGKEGVNDLKLESNKNLENEKDLLNSLVPLVFQHDEQYVWNLAQRVYLFSENRGVFFLCFPLFANEEFAFFFNSTFQQWKPLSRKKLVTNIDPIIEYVSFLRGEQRKNLPYEQLVRYIKSDEKVHKFAKKLYEASFERVDGIGWFLSDLEENNLGYVLDGEKETPRAVILDMMSDFGMARRA